MKHIRLPIVNVFLMLWKWWLAVREKMEFLHTAARSWLLFLHDGSECKNLNQILLEVLMNCTKHFDLSSSSTACCVARFMICWVCRLYFSGLVCLVLSLDECLIKITYGRFCLALRKLCRLVWHRVWLICNVKRYFHWTTIFLQKMAGLVEVKFMVNIVVWSGLSMLEVCCKVDFKSLLAVEGNFLAVSRVLLRTLDECKCFDAWRKWSCRVVYVWPRTNSDTIVSMFIWFCNLEWMIYRGTLIWCDLLTLKIYQVEGTVLVSVRI